MSKLRAFERASVVKKVILLRSTSLKKLEWGNMPCRELTGETAWRYPYMAAKRIRSLSQETTARTAHLAASFQSRLCVCLWALFS